MAGRAAPVQCVEEQGGDRRRLPCCPGAADAVAVVGGADRGGPGRRPETKAASMSLLSLILFNTDFGDEFGDDPPQPLDGPAFHMDPFYLLGGAVIIGIVVGVVAAVMSLARNRAERRVRTDCEASAKAIYDCVKYHLDRALRAPGSAIIDRGREVADVLEARLGA